MRLHAAVLLFGGLFLSIEAPLAPAAEPLAQTLRIEPLGLALRYPKGWSATSEKDRAWIVNAPLNRATGPALNALTQIFVSVEHRTDHADAIQRLRGIASEYEAPVTYLTIGGWPALQRTVVIRKEQPGAENVEAHDQQLLLITTAIAAGDLVVRADARMPPDASEKQQEEVRAIEAGMTLQHSGNPAVTDTEVKALQARPRLEPLRPPPSEVKPAPPPQRQGLLERPRLLLEGANARSEEEDRPKRAKERREEQRAGEAGAAAPVINGGFASEPEIAVSTDGQNIVVAQQFAYATSNDGGLTFPITGAFPSSDGGDSSLAYGKSGNFYEGTIFKTSSALNVSTDNGKTFKFDANAFTCPTTGRNQCGFTRNTPPAPFPDQEHIAADRFNAGANGDQVYDVWRQGNGSYGISCSTNSGANFGTAQFKTGDYPRITVAQDGFVYVVSVSGGAINIDKFGSCQSGLNYQTGFPQTVASGISVTCPVAGLDRCNNGNQLSSSTVAVDDANPSHIYVAYAQSSGSGESVVVQDSPDGGKTWSSSARAVTVSSNATARRFMPWMCASNGLPNVTWYDRRAATTAKNDLTDYYGANACVTGSGNIAAGDEFQINASGSSDSQCLAGKTVGSAASWPSASRATGDSTTCSEQPELGGKCRHNPNNNTDSFQACNFNAPACPVNETCQTGGGRPKYGDYNGNACAAGKLYTVWASATPPPGGTPSGNVDLYFSSRSIPGLFGETAVIWRYSGQPCSGGSCQGWLALDDNPATVAIAASDTTLYQLHATGAIWRWTGVGCSSGGCGGWQQLDNNPSTKAIAVGSDELYQLHNDGSIWHSTGLPGGWEMLDSNPSTAAITAGGNQLFQLHNDGSIWRWTGAPGGWQMLDGNSSTTAITAGDQLFQLHNDGSIWRWTGVPGGWQMLDGNPSTTAITAGNQLFQLHNDGSIWRWTGVPGGWQMLDGNPSTTAITSAGDQLFQLHNDGSIWRWTGVPGGWEQVDDNSNSGMIAGGGAQLYQEHSALVYQLHADGSVWRHTGPGCAGGCCTGWEMLDGNTSTMAITAAGNQLFQLHNDGSIWRSTGTLGGWQMLDGNSSTTAITAGNQLFQLHDDGSIWRSTGLPGGWQTLDRCQPVDHRNYRGGRSALPAPQ